MERRERWLRAAFVAAFCGLLTALSPVRADQVLVVTGAVWRFQDDGTDAGTAWRETGFDDTGWSAGPAELGYGDGNEATVVSYGDNVSNRYVTTYFRHAFVLPATNALNYLDLRLRRDDGAIVYLNGDEVWRSNMPTGSVDYLTAASAQVGGPGEIRFFEGFTPTDGRLRQGTNVFAVEVHQYEPASDDLSFDFACTALERPVPAQLLRGPYLQSGTHTSAVVRWRTDVLRDSRVWYGATPDDLSFTATVAASGTEHAVQVSGLEPGTTYYYAIGDAWDILAGGDTNHFWVTHPPPGLIQPVRVWVLGDSGTADAHAAGVRDAFAAWTGTRSPDFWLMLGDNAYIYGRDAEYQAAVFDMYPTTLRTRFLWPAQGNHDFASSSAETGPYYDIFHLPGNGQAGGVPSGTEAYYALDFANLHLVCLNTFDVDRSTNGAMYAWLAADLASTEQDWVVAFFHHPPYTAGSHDSDTEPDLIEVRENLVPLLEAHNVDLVLAGHSHAYERSPLLRGHYGYAASFQPSMIVDGGDGREDGDGVYDKTSTSGTVYVVAGSSGKVTASPPAPHPAYLVATNLLGSLVFDVMTNRLDVWFVTDTAETMDYFSIVKGTTSHALRVEAKGSGRVTPVSGLYREGATVQLTAVPDPFHAFTGWSGDLAGTVNPVTVDLAVDVTVTGAFDAILVTNDVPQWWLAAHGLPPSDAAALDDEDLDTSFTWQEYIADTDPTNAGSHFAIDRIMPSHQMHIRFNGSTQRVYSLEFATGLASWTNIEGQVRIPGMGPLTELVDPALPLDRRYRVVVELPPLE